MLECIKRNRFFLCFVYIALWTSLNSSGVNRIYPLPPVLNKIIAVLIYAPFICFILWKLYTDIVGRRKNFVNLVYYTFSLYFIGVETYRFFSGMEVKESLYYFLLLFGAVALFLQIRDGHLVVLKNEYMANILAIAVFVVAFQVIYGLFVENYLPYSPININIISGILALVFPVLISFLCDKKITKRQRAAVSAALIASLVVICTAGSRSIFLLVSVIIIVLLISKIISKNTKDLLYVGGVCLSAFAIVMLMAVLNVGDVRYALYRQTNLSFFGVNGNTSESNYGVDDVEMFTDEVEFQKEEESVDAKSTANSTEINTLDNETQNNSVENSAQIQVSQSDGMRANLIEMGIEQIKINPWFGTGDIFYPYGMTEDYIPEQTSHNFIIESIIAFGFVGFLLLIVLFIAILQMTGIFQKGIRSCWEFKLSLVLTLLFYFGFGLVEPTVYNQFLTLTFAICLSAYSFMIVQDNAK